MHAFSFPPLLAEEIMIEDTETEIGTVTVIVIGIAIETPEEIALEVTPTRVLARYIRQSFLI